jgi:predicted DNA-binding antitoxin AbrB/MazE fold protein
MSLVVNATYENGTLKLDTPLPLQENQRVKVTVEQSEAVPAPLTYGLIGWTGDPGVVRRIALDPEFGIQESP